jgi:hypothetical protein
MSRGKGSPRPDRWVRLYDLGRALQKSDARLMKLGRRALRQRVYRMVRELELFHERSFSRTWRNRLYVSVSAIDRIKPVGDQRLGELETNQAAQGQKLRAVERQTNALGSRVRNLEKWRELTSKYMADVAALECADSDSEPQRRAG